MASNSELLAAVDAAIAKRLAGDAYEEYTEGGNGGDRFRGTALSTLYEIRKDLAAKVASENGDSGAPTFLLAEPFAE